MKMELIAGNIYLPFMPIVHPSFSKSIFAEGKVDRHFAEWGIDKLVDFSDAGNFSIANICEDFTYDIMFRSVESQASRFMKKEHVHSFAFISKSRLVRAPATNYFPFAEEQNGVVKFFVARIFVRKDGSMELYVYERSDQSEWCHTGEPENKRKSRIIFLK